MQSFRHTRKPQGPVYVQVFLASYLRSVLIIKATKCTNFSNLFLNKILHVSDSSFAHHQELFTVHSNGIYNANFVDSKLSAKFAVCTVKNS